MRIDLSVESTDRASAIERLRNFAAELVGTPPPTNDQPERGPSSEPTDGVLTQAQVDARAALIASKSQTGDGFTVGDIGAVLWGIGQPLSSKQMSALSNAAVKRGLNKKWRPTYDELREIQKNYQDPGRDAESGDDAESTGTDANKPNDPPPPDNPPAAPTDSKIHDAEGDLLRDRDGRTWDARIHAPSQMILKGNGCWKRKRNVSDDLVAQVHGEQDARDGQGQQSQDDPPPPPAATGQDDPPPPPAATGQDDGNPPADKGTGQDGDSPLTAFMERVNAANISIVDVRAVIQSVDPSLSLVQLQHHPEKLAEVEALLFA